jgi:hypothetical protein
MIIEWHVAPIKIRVVTARPSSDFKPSNIAPKIANGDGF